MLQTINFSDEFDFKAIHDYIKRIPKIKKLKNQSIKMTILEESTTNIAIPVKSNSINDGLAMLYQQYHDSKMILPKIVNIDENKNKLSITYMPYLDAPYRISLKILK